MLVGAGLVLLNSAGKIEPGYEPEPEGDVQAAGSFVPPRLVVELLSRGLFLCAAQMATCISAPVPADLLCVQICTFNALACVLSCLISVMPHRARPLSRQLHLCWQLHLC